MSRLLTLLPLLVLITINIVCAILYCQYVAQSINYVTSGLLLLNLGLYFVKEEIAIVLTGIIILLCNFGVLQLYFGLIVRPTFIGIPFDLFMLILFVIYFAINGKKIGEAYHSINNSLSKLDK